MNFCRRIICVLLTIAPISAFSGVISDLQPGQWLQLNNTKLQDQNPCPDDDCAYSANIGFEGIMSLWSGGAFDSTQNRLIVWGGGHLGYFGNGVYAFDLDQTDTGEWFSLIAPDNETATEDEWLAGEYSDGSPISRHTYNHLVFVTSQNTFMTTGGSAFSPIGSRGDGRFWKLDFDNPTVAWSEATPAESGSITQGYAAYNEATDMVYYHHSAGGRFYKYDPTTDTHTYLTQKPLGIYGTAAVDTSRNRMLVLGGSTNPQAFYWDLSQDTPTNTNLLDNTLFNNASGQILADDGQFGLDYDPVNDRFVAWRGGKTVYIINPETFEVSTFTPEAGDDPGDELPLGTYGRFRYAPSIGGFILANGVDKDVFLFKLNHSSSSSDWAARSTAPGVLMATRFDTQNEVDNWIHLDGSKDNVKWEQEIASSGNGSLRMDILKTDGANSGNWRRWLADDQREFVEGDEFYVSYRQYTPRYYAHHVFNGGGGWKQSIISRNAYEMNGDLQSCNNGANCGSNQLNEVVLNNSLYRGLVQGYNRNSNGAYPSWEQFANTACSSTDFVMQNAVDRGPQNVGTSCENARAQYGGLYSYGARTGEPDPLTGAFTYTPDGWMTFKIYVKLGSQGTNTENSHVKVWAAKDGEDFELLIDRNDLDLGDGPAHNTLWLLPYDTGKQPNPNRQDTYTLYDEVIVSLNDIAAPGQANSIDPPEPPQSAEMCMPIPVNNGKMAIICL